MNANSKSYFSSSSKDRLAMDERDFLARVKQIYSSLLVRASLGSRSRETMNTMLSRESNSELAFLQVSTAGSKKRLHGAFDTYCQPLNGADGKRHQHRQDQRNVPR